MWFVMGFIFISFSVKEIACKEEVIFRKYENDFSNKQFELQRTYDNKIQNLEEKIDNNTKVIENFKQSQNIQSKK